MVRRVTTKPAARALGVSPETLRRWLREGRFAHVDGLEYGRVGLQEHRYFTAAWINGVASELGIEADFSEIDAADD